MPEPTHLVLSCTAFVGQQRLLSGELSQVVTTAKVRFGETTEPVLIFCDATGEQVDVDLQGPLKQILKHLPTFGLSLPKEAAAEVVAVSGPGRPKLGVTAREVTLLPRHWAWLSEQPGGASVTLRKLVEEARRASHQQDEIRRARESCYRFMAAIAGNQSGFEDASRALFTGQRAVFEKALSGWPADVREYAMMLASKAFASEDVG